VGGAGTWDNTNNAGMWKTTSGGTINAPNAPLATDTANFDIYSGTGAVSIAASATCANCTFDGPGITATLTANHTTTFTQLLIYSGTFDCSTFNHTMQTLYVFGGTFTCNGGTITITAGLNATGAVARTINLNNSTLSVAGSINMSGSNLTLNAGTSQLNLASPGSTITFFAGQSLYNVTFTSTQIGTSQVITNLSCNNLTFASTIVGSYGFSLGSNLTVNGILTIPPSTTTQGVSRFSIISSVIGTPRTITASTVSLRDDMDFRDITIVGTGWSGNRFGDCGGNTNITFSTAKTVYWNLAGSQNNSATGWATTPTGTPANDNFPLAQDTAIFTDTNPAASATLTCLHAYHTGTLDFSARTLSLAFSNSQSLNIYGNLTLSSTVTFSGSTISTFVGRNKTQIITTAGKSFVTNVTQNTIGGGVVFADAFSLTGSYTLTSGSLSTNYNFTAVSINANIGTNTRSVTFGANTVTLTQNFIMPASGFTFNAGTSQINFTGTGSVSLGASNVTNPPSFTFYNVSVNSTSTGTPLFGLYGVNTFNNLTISSKISEGIFNISITGSLTVNGTLTLLPPTILGSCRHSIRSNTLGVTSAITAASVSLHDDIDFRDITVLGNVWSGTRFGDCGGNTNIIFPASKTVYWNLSGASEIYSIAWATTPTGTPLAINFPLAQDNAIFTNNNPSSGATVIMSYRYAFNTIDYTNRTLPLTLTNSAGHELYGDALYSSSLTSNGTGQIVFCGRNKTQILRSAGFDHNSYIYNIQTIGGGVVFEDAFVGSGVSAGIVLNYGSLSTNYNVTFGYISSSNTNVRSLSMGSGTWTTLNGSIAFISAATSTNFTLNAGTSKIVVSTSASTLTFSGGGLTYYDLEIGGTTSTASFAFSGSNTFNTISSTRTSAYPITFNTGTTTTVANWAISGTAENLVTLRSSTSTGTSDLVKSGGGIVNSDYLRISGINASPVNTWYAGTHSTDVGNNTGWQFIVGVISEIVTAISNFFLLF
jgi:hypothetical protein